MSSRRGWHKPDKFKQERVRLSVTLEQHVPIESEILRYLSHVHSSDISRVVRAIFILGFRQHCKEQGLDIGNQDHYQSQVLNGVAEIPLQHLMRKPNFEVELSSPIIEKKPLLNVEVNPVSVEKVEAPLEEVYVPDDIEYVHHEVPVVERKIQQSHQTVSTPKPQSNNGRSSFLNRSSDYWNEAQQANQVEDKKVQVPVYQNLDHGAL